MKTLTGLITAVCLALPLAAGIPGEPEFININIWPKAKSVGQLHEIVEDSHGYLWATSTFGVFRFDGHTVKGYFNTDDSTSLSHSFTEALFVDSDDDIWIGGANGLNRYRYATDDFVRFEMEDVSEQRIYRIHEDFNKNFWVGTGAGLVFVNRQTWEKELFVPDEWEPYSVRGIRAIAMDRDDANRVWAGGVLGLFSFDRNTKELKHHPMPYSNKAGRDCMITQMFLDSEGVMWCGTWGVYILSYNTSTGEWDQYTTGKGIVPYQDSVIFDMHVRDEHSFWVANGTGAGIFNKTDGTYYLYEHEHGNPRSLESSYSYFGMCITKAGNMVVAGQSAISISSQVAGLHSGIPFSPVITRVAIGDTHLASDSSVMEIHSISLEDHQKDVSLTLALPGVYFFEPTFTYRLEGYDSDWKSLVRGNTIRYTNLPGGSYTLLYRASIDGQTWEAGQPLSIRKHVFFWNTAAFYLLISLIVLGVVLLIYFLRIRFIRREAALKTEFNKKLADIEMAALRAQMNPHFLFNSLNSIKYYILNEEPDLANKYLTKFSRLMRLVLKNSQSQLVTLADEMEALRLYVQMEALRFKEDFQYDIKVDDNIIEEETSVPPLIIQPYVENAIWHGLLQKEGPGKLSVRITKSGEKLRISIEDDGIGREAAALLQSKSATKKSFGTRITGDRIALVSSTLGIEASIHVEDLKNEADSLGTRVTIELPFLTDRAIQSSTS